MVGTLGGLGAKAPLLHGLESKLSHETHQAIASTADSLASEHLLEPTSAVGAAALAKEQLDLLSQLLVLKAAGPLGLGPLSIEPTPTDP